MSGLVSFFKDFFPNVQNIDYSRNLEDLTAHEKGEAPLFAKKPENQESPTTHQQFLQALSKPPKDPPVQLTPDPVTFREWRKYNEESLKVFYLRRFVTLEEDQDDSDQDSENDDDEDDDVWESDVEVHDDQQEEAEQEVEDEEDGGNELGLESQPTSILPQTTATTIAATAFNRPKRRIPPLYQAIHSIQTLDYLDLRTKDLSLPLCRVTRICRLRETKRGFHYLASAGGEYSTRCSIFPGRMPRVAFGYMQDDGPMSSAYEFCLSLQVQQLLPTPLHAATAKGGTPRKSVIRIFLYNAYAKAVSEWMEEQSIKRKDSRKDGFILSLTKIPALSVFPYALDPRDWWDQQHVVHYCLCLGDASNLAASYHSDGTTEEIRADSDDMELRIATATLPGEEAMGEELVVSKSMLMGPLEDSEDYDAPPPNQHLLETWKNFVESKNSRQPAALMPAPVTMEATGGQAAAAPLTTAGPLVPPTVPPAMPNFSTAVSHSEHSKEAAAPAPVAEPTVRVPPNRPPPPSPVVRSVESMTFQGSARKRPRITDVTNLSDPSATAVAAPTQYISLASLKSYYDANCRGDGRFINPSLTVNIYGVVMGFTAPSQTKRGDWMLTATLVDETCTVPVTLVVFTKRHLLLPKFERMGDVLRLHRVGLQIWKGEVQLTGKRVSSYVVVRRSRDASSATTTTTAASPSTNACETDIAEAPWVVVPTATKEYAFEESDEERSQCLWHWGQRLLRQQPTMTHSDHRFTIADMANVADDDEEKIRDRDLTVMVTAKIPFPTDALTGITARGFLRVWDGTGQAPSDPLPIPTAVARQTQSTGDPPASALTRIAYIIEKLKGSYQDDVDISRLETPESACGKVANVVIWEAAHWELVLAHVPIGSFIRLRNVDVRPWNNQPFRSFMVHPKTWLSPLPDETYEIRTLLIEHDRRVKRKEYNPMSGLLPLLSDALQEVRTLLQSASGKDTAREEKVDASPARTTNVKLGNGLAEFACRPATSSEILDAGSHPSKKRRKNPNDVYNGIVRLLEPTIPAFNGNLQVYCSGTPPAYRLVATVSDDSKSLNVIVASPVADNIFRVPAADAAAQGGRWIESPFDPNQAWKVKLRGLLKNGQRYFVMTDIKKVEGD